MNEGRRPTMTKFDSAEIPISNRKPFAEEAPIMISQDDARQGSMGHQLLYVLGSGRRRHQRPKLLSLRKLRNHLQFGGSPYCPASQRTKAVKATIKNCPKVRSRRTISLVLCTGPAGDRITPRHRRRSAITPLSLSASSPAWKNLALGLLNRFRGRQRMRPPATTNARSK